MTDSVRPLVSIVIPAHNAQETVAAAVTSALQQEEVTTEVIVVDDASSDATLERLAPWVAAGQVAVRALDRNRGPSTARNEGLRHARGRYVAFLDADDEWVRHKLARQVAALAASPGSIAAITAAADPVSKRSTAPDGPAGAQPVTWEDVMLRRFSVVAGSTLIGRREDLLEAGGFNEAMRVFEDVELVVRLLARGTMLRLAAPLALVRPSGRPRDADKLDASAHEFLATLTRLAADVPAEHERLARQAVCLWAAKAHLRSRRPRRARPWIRRARAADRLPPVEWLGFARQALLGWARR